MNAPLLASRLIVTGTTGFVVVHLWALLGAVWHYRRACTISHQRPTIAGLRRYLLPGQLLRSRWTRLDLALLLTHRLFQLLVFQFVVALTIGVAGLVAMLLGAVHGGRLLHPGLCVDAVFLLAGVAARDAASFGTHYLQHKIPLLWEFHKVHHAPETLIPATTRRLHPLDELTGIAAEGLLLGSVVGVQAWLTGSNAAALIVPATILYAAINMLLFAPLRHSHIDLRLGRFERVVFSPAHHQIHHSSEVQHWDRNFGSILTLWDRLCGTFLVPEPHGSYRLGLPDGQSEAYATVVGCYVAPLRQSWQLLRRASARRRGAEEERPGLRPRPAGA